jgi:hypothetical protein
LDGVTNAEFRVELLTVEAIDAWAEGWDNPDGENDPPKGGWDWADIRDKLINQKGYFGLSIWSGDQLCGLAVGHVNKTAVALDFVERSPSADCPLKGNIILIALETATVYAQELGRSQLWLMDPDEDLLEWYQESYGFSDLAKTSQKTPYCWREV